MATREDPKKTDANLDDLLKCTICLETFKDPKYLPCLHTFCTLCIHTYIDSFKGKKSEIACPICRKPISSSERADDTDSIVDKLPSNNFVVSLIEKQTRTERQCNLCDVQGRQSQAVSWCAVCEESYCEGCVKFHKSNKSLAKHKIVLFEDLQNKTIGLEETTVLFCDDHHESEVQVYCVDHKKACCTLCATLSHRKCDKVISIEEAAAGVKQNGEVSCLLSKLETLEKLLEDVMICRNEHEETFDTEAINIETAVTKIVKEMKDHLDKIQSKILCELEAAKKQTSMKVTDDINDLTSFKSTVTNWKNMLVGVLQHGSEQQCLVIQNVIAPKVEKLQDEVKNSIEKIRNDSIRFEVSTIAKEFNEEVASIGELTHDNSKLKFESGKPQFLKPNFRNGEIKVIRTINVAASGETSGIFMDSNLLFTAKSTTKVLKYNQKGKMLGELTVPNQPTDLCHVSDIMIVVASESESELYMIDCLNMTLLRTTKLADVPLYSVCVYDNNQFLIGSYEQLTWIDQSSGTKVKSVTTSGYSIYVSTSRNNDYIHGNGLRSVTYVVNETEKFTYKNDDLFAPFGNAIDCEGNFYIAALGTNTIHQITENGELIRIIPTSDLDMETPLVVRFEKGTNRFLVTCNSGKASLCCID